MPALIRRVLSVPLAAALLAYDALDALFGPLVRPILRWAASLRLFARIGAAIASLPPYAALLTLALPFVAIEPFKFVALYWLASGHTALGGVAFVLSHLGSILICERIFHAGKAQILRIGWFARGYGFVTDLRDRALAWIRATAVWRAGRRLVDRGRTAARSAGEWLALRRPTAPPPRSSIRPEEPPRRPR